MHEILLIVVLIIIIIFIFGMVINYNNSNNNSNNNNQCNFLPNISSPSMSSQSMSSPSILKRPPATTGSGCYEESWGINSVGYELENFPSIEEYSYKYYNNNLNNTDMQNIPFNFGDMIQDN